MELIIMFFVVAAISVALGYFYVQGRNSMQAKAVADELEKRKKNGTL